MGTKHHKQRHLPKELQREITEIDNAIKIFGSPMRNGAVMISSTMYEDLIKNHKKAFEIWLKQNNQENANLCVRYRVGRSEEDI